ncbi:hypothetical protein [Ammoniphilus sp. 3BR4]|uniref:hypothetical protein n=1 Tax=Ammoniphilus sp. 3BR4 TaxID=3158265 RepID=UPI00346541FB
MNEKVIHFADIGSALIEAKEQGQIEEVYQIPRTWVENHPSMGFNFLEYHILLELNCRGAGSKYSGRHSSSKWRRRRGDRKWNGSAFMGSLRWKIGWHEEIYFG